MLYVNPLAGMPGKAVEAAAARGVDPKAAREKDALQEFERFFVYQLMREMRKSVPKNELFGESQTTSFFEEMLDDVMAGEIAKSGQFGIAKQIELQLRQQEASLKERGLTADNAGGTVPAGGVPWI